MYPKLRSMTRTLIMIALPPLLGGCAAVALTAAGVGSGVAAGHHLGGYAYRTFTETMPRVRSATYVALRRMAIPPGKTEKIDQGERIVTKIADRTLEIEIESLTPNTTRVRAVAKKESGIIVDASTAIEVLTQIEKAVAGN